MRLKAAAGFLSPFLGTALGAAGVFFLRGALSVRLEMRLNGFASGVMAAASFFSLLLPAVEQAGSMGRLAFLPATSGFLAGVLFLLALDAAAPRIRRGAGGQGPRAGLRRAAKLALAVTIHNLPEGMAVGIVFAGWMYGDADIAFAAAMALSLGIAVQNIPEGAIVSMPLRAEGVPRGRAFALGALSGAVEPAGALLTALAAGLFLPVMPYLLGFAAGAMLYVVVGELIPETAGDGCSRVAAVHFALGFALMMALDAALS